MKSNTRSISIILALILVLSLCGCATTDENTASPSVPSPDLTPLAIVSPSPSIAPNPAPTTNTYSKPADTSSGSLKNGEYWCMGKNDTCKNKTYDPYDYYCSSCDPDGDNVEG